MYGASDINEKMKKSIIKKVPTVLVVVIAIMAIYLINFYQSYTFTLQFDLNYDDPYVVMNLQKEITRTRGKPLNISQFEPIYIPTGVEFTGWYWDKQCTIPVEDTEPINICLRKKVKVYAGWKATQLNGNYDFYSNEEENS